ncbi:MAG: TlpA disulfide reductase family protein [Burkholderiales bacterium]
MNEHRPAPTARPQGRRQLLAVAGVAATAAAGGVALAWWQRTSSTAAPDNVTTAPAVMLLQQSFQMVDGTTLSMRDFSGRPLLVNFWASWCAPCVEEMPMLDAFYAAHRAHGWQLVGLAADQLPAVQRFLQSTPVSFPIALVGLAGIQLSRQLGNEAGGLPFTLLVDRAGRIRQRKLGQLSRSELDSWVKSIG